MGSIRFIYSYIDYLKSQKISRLAGRVTVAEWLRRHPAINSGFAVQVLCIACAGSNPVCNDFFFSLFISVIFPLRARSEISKLLNIMSQSLIIFRGSGRVEYLSNNKINPFNEFISNGVNDLNIELEQGYFTNNLNQKRFYSFQKDDLYAAIYFDAISTIDNKSIKQFLQDVLKIYLRMEEDDEQSKMKQMIDLKLNQLMKLKIDVATEKPTAESSKATTPSRSSTPKASASKKKSGAKKMRKWDGDEMVEVDDSNNKTLDYSKGNPDSAQSASAMKVDQSAFVKENEFVLMNEINDILNENDSDNDEDTPAQKGAFFSKLTLYFGGQVDLDDVSKKFNDQLISKNVSPATAKTIIDKIKHNLKGKKVTTQVYKDSLVDELTKILTPNVSTDLLQEIKKNKGGPRPYVISVVGVNGVGKSTNLAKLAFWFLQNNMNVLICACDTFRSGAVEQLKVHVDNLQNLNNANTKIEIYEKGYGSGDHVVNTAKLAIQFAADQKFDIVLIDTAGRTHSNNRLMAPLKKFGDAANPNKIIMVGEALVGTDSVEQATNFNNAFGNRRGLDFFIISKVDTVGDLVGTMINMVMATKVPILFLGTGQTYTDIKRLSAKAVVDMLMN